MTAPSPLGGSDPSGRGDPLSISVSLGAIEPSNGPSSPRSKPRIALHAAAAATSAASATGGTDRRIAIELSRAGAKAVDCDPVGLRSAVLGAVFAFAACTHDFDAFEGSRDASAPDASTEAAPVPTATPDAGRDAGVPCTETDAERAAGHCYFRLPSNNVTFAEAQSGCSGVGAHLVTIGAAAEDAVVRRLLRGRDPWIGLKRAAGSPSVDASFAWITGEARSFVGWGSAEPNATGECVAMTDTGWNDQSCTQVGGAICERE
jgi:hypothetical protein